MDDLPTYELSPKPGITASERRAELLAARFVAVRNLVYIQYKNPDGKPLMDYGETLQSRELVIQTVLQYELYNKFILPDVFNKKQLEEKALIEKVKRAVLDDLDPKFNALRSSIETMRLESKVLPSRRRRR